MAHFDKHSTSIKALVDVSEAMLNAMEKHGIDPETVANRNEFTVMIHFLKSIIDGIKYTKRTDGSHQRCRVPDGHGSEDRQEVELMIKRTQRLSSLFKNSASHQLGEKR